jgi:hypothetical protein
MQNKAKKEKQIVCFLHIEKAAGTTIHEILKNNYWNYFRETPYVYKRLDKSQNQYLKSEELLSIRKKIPFFKAFGGHSIRLWEDYGRLLDQDVFYFTFFRHPVKRYLSNYFFQKYNMSIERSFEEYLSDSYFHNFMTNKICGESDDKKAIEILNQYNVFIGFVEDFDASLVLLRRELSGKALFNINYEKKNVNKNKYSDEIDDLLERYKDQIYNNNEVDCKLYDYFFQRFRQGPRKQINVHKLVKLQKENVNYKFSRVKRKLQHKLRRLYFQKVERSHRDQSSRKLSI